ncbi:Glutamine-tRNA ligase [Coccomyxa sp. Obi]|nr:Glutamine-tRNA ligase [Coccomyxa sp. Obi]
MASREEQEKEAERIFLSIGLAEKTAKTAVSKKKFRGELLEVIEEAGLKDGCDKARGTLLYTSASTYPANAMSHRRHFIQEYISTGKLKSSDQLEAAFKFLSSCGEQPVDWKKLEESAGIGVEVTPAQIAEEVAKVLNANKEQLVTERYHMNTGKLLAAVKTALKWADGSRVKQELDHQILQLLGPKTEQDLVKPDKKKVKEKKPKENGAVAEAAPANAEDTESWRHADPYAFLPNPAENNKVHTTVNFSNGTQLRIANSAEKLAEHLKVTGGKVVTRFPPEPNGYLHIGHAKAMFVDFGYAERYNGDCYLRFDDTNPEAEKQEYIDHIQDIVAWLGYTPYKVTYSSDYFTELHNFAVQLIKSGNAYVDHQTADEIKAYREERRPSPWRDRPVEESLKLFEDMRRGLVDEGKATLRMRMDPKNDNYNMFDLIAYRIKFTPHPHAGDAWCIYPSYDYTHCLVDALENITHSLCTLEFESRRASYYWLLHVLDTYKPVVWEYARLNITHNVLSKRKLNRLVTDGYVHGWDDPRLLTLAGLRRRGVTPQAIKNLCQEIGITRSDGEIHLHKLDHHIRADLDATSPRALAVLEPLRLVLTNLPADHFLTCDARVFPGRTEETYPVPLTRVVYIAAEDFREVDSKGYYALAPQKEVMLKYAGIVKCTGFEKSGGKVTEVRGEFRPLQAGEKPPKGVLSWVGQPTPGVDPTMFEARLYDVLFKTSSVADTGDDWLEDLNSASLTTKTGAVSTPRVTEAAPGTRFQMERLGYFCVDPDSRPGKLVLNRTCTLKETNLAALKGA